MVRIRLDAVEPLYVLTDVETFWFYARFCKRMDDMVRMEEMVRPGRPRVLLMDLRQNLERVALYFGIGMLPAWCQGKPLRS